MESSGLFVKHAHICVHADTPTQTGSAENVQSMPPFVYQEGGGSTYVLVSA